MTIEQATVTMLLSLNVSNELARDMVGIAIFSVIGYSAVKRIVETDDFPEYKEADLFDLFDEIEHMNINELAHDFLKEKE